MPTQPTRNDLMQRIVALEAAHAKRLRGSKPGCNGDVSGRKRQELERKLLRAIQALRTSNAKYRDLFENAGDAIFLHDLDGTIIDANQRALALLAYTKAELLAIKIPALHPPQALKSSRRAFETILREGHVRLEIDFVTKDGEIIPTEVTSSLLEIGNQKVIQGIVRDIRERRLAAQARRETLAIIAKSPVTVFLWRNTADWPVEFASQNVSRIFGYSAEAFQSGRVVYRDVVHPADFEHVLDEVVAYSQDPEHVEFTHEPYRIVAKDGRVRWVNDHTVIRRDHTGTITHYQGIVEDITAARQATIQLAAEKERLAVTLRSIGDAVITTDRDGCIVLINPVAEKLTGWREGEALGRPLLEVFRIVDARTGEPCASPVDQVLASGQTVGLANHTLLIAKDGPEFYITNSGAPILDDKSEIVGVVLVFRDMTERQQIEKELLKMEKLQSLGVLAGGLAHDFNNFLTGILGNLSLAKLEIGPGHPVARSLDAMEKASLRAKDLTQQLLTFSKGGAPEKATVSITELVREATQFALRGSNVGYKLQIEEALHPAEVDAGQMTQVFQNLVINADQAMPDGGTITMRGRNRALPPDNLYALEPGKYVELAVSDQGLGIKAEHLKKVFDPYFTTKQRGSGLGLAVAFSIIAKHDGHLTVDSRLGVGTTFTMLLPASVNAVVNDAPRSPRLEKGRGRILVMDDEDFIRDLAAMMLQKMGYTVALAEDGQTAVAMYAEALESGRAFDAVILDLTVPGGMGGKETVRELHAIDPDVRALVSSGYSNDPVMANYQDHGFCGAVKKPYMVQEMGNLLSKVIQG